MTTIVARHLAVEACLVTVASLRAVGRRMTSRSAQETNLDLRVLDRMFELAAASFEFKLLEPNGGLCLKTKVHWFISDLDGGIEMKYKAVFELSGLYGIVNVTQN